MFPEPPEQPPMASNDQPQAPNASAQGEVIFDASVADFEQRIIKASMETPVIVDFWAPWCGPCKQLTPILENAVSAAGGEVLLAKVNMDENQQLAQALQVQSIPAVFAFFGGRPIDAFQGVQPESKIKAFIDHLVQLRRQNQPEAIDIPAALEAAAQALQSGDLMNAQGVYAQVLAQDENNGAAYGGLVRTFIAADQLEQARGLVDNVLDGVAKDTAFIEAKTALELAENAPDQSELAGLEAASAKNPKDHQARFDLAVAQFAAGAREQACENLLHIIATDRAWNEDGARSQLLKLFEAMGMSDPVTLEMRRKLSSLLFS